MSIIEQIEALPDDASGAFTVEHVDERGKVIGKGLKAFPLSALFRASDLKALAASHERLLAAAKAVDDDMQGANTLLETRIEFGKAIEQAENLKETK